MFFSVLESTWWFFQFLIVLGGSSKFLIVPGSSSKFLMVFNGSSQFLMVLPFFLSFDGA